MTSSPCSATSPGPVPGLNRHRAPDESGLLCSVPNRLPDRSRRSRCHGRSAPPPTSRRTVLSPTASRQTALTPYGDTPCPPPPLPATPPVANPGEPQATGSLFPVPFACTTGRPRCPSAPPPAAGGARGPAATGPHPRVRPGTDRRGLRRRAPGRPERARSLLVSALDLWRGKPPAGVPGPYAEAQRTRLEELRLAASEARWEAEIALGGHETRSVRCARWPPNTRGASGSTSR
ncbi:hypothetical protein GO001_31575 [Streptomyces sp. NRRL B-1677]|nr:hypothetical protein [Streptomyces sp. NRRL B-1677]